MSALVAAGASGTTGRELNIDIFSPQANISLRFPGLTGLKLQMRVFEIYGVPA